MISFEVDRPVSPGKMVGRRAEAAKIQKWVREGRLTILTSPPRYGKTTLIGKVGADAERDGLAAVIVDLYEVASLVDLVLRLERAWSRCAPERLRPLAQKILTSSQTGASISGAGFAPALADRPGTDPLPALQALLDLPSQLARREWTQSLIVLDEFHYLLGIPEAGALLHATARAQRGVATYLLSGSDSGMIGAAFAEAEQVSAEPVGTVRLDRLPAAELAEAICQQFARVDCDVTGVLDKLVAASEGHPQRAMLLAQMLLEELAGSGRATGDHLDDAITASLRRVDPELRAVLGGLTPGQRKVVRAVAEYGTPMAARAVRMLGLPKTTAQKAVPHLVATGMIEETEREWRVNDPLLARWIRNNYGTRAQ